MSFAVACVQAPHLEDIVKSRRARENAAPHAFPARSRVLALLASLAQIGELARRLVFAASDSTSATFVIQVVNLLLTWQGEDKKKEREDDERGWGRLFEGRLLLIRENTLNHLYGS